MDWREIEVALSGGHPNSLGNTVAVVEDVLAGTTSVDSLIDCYASNDEVVRLRVSNALKRICQQRPDWVFDRVDRLVDEVAPIRQASTHWTLAQIFLELTARLNPQQRARAVGLMKDNLDQFDDWIVINQTLETLGRWAKQDPSLRDWLVPRLWDYSQESRRSIAGKARRHLGWLGEYA